ncbi:MAG: class I tRNA ligase family protein, partial [Candidatus Limnocylindria bacterium]
FPDDPEAFAHWWPADVHVIGKNITRFHCLNWPAMLMSAGLPLPRQVFAHGFMLMRGEKMSKTRGNVLDPAVAQGLFGVDGVRYLVLREIPFDRDGDVTAEGLVRRYNAELANDLGNLVNRTVSMAGRYLDGHLPDVGGLEPTDTDAELRAAAEAAAADYRAAVERLHFDEALAALARLTRATNGYAESQAPWALHKAGKSERTAAVLANLGEACRILGHLLAPFCPGASADLLGQVGTPPPYDGRGAGGPGLDTLLTWGAEPGPRRTGPPAPLFPRVEVEPDEWVVDQGVPPP